MTYPSNILDFRFWILDSIQNRQSKIQNSTGGFTPVELLVVMVIIGLLAALVVPRFIRQEEKAKVKATQAQIELLGTALDTLRLDVGRYPTTQEGLNALRRQPGDAQKWDGPYLKKEVPLDPWGRAYIYRSPGEDGPHEPFFFFFGRGGGGGGGGGGVSGGSGGGGGGGASSPPRPPPPPPAPQKKKGS